MTLDFPAAPQIDDIYLSGGAKWRWDGDKWLSLGLAGPIGPVGPRGPQGPQGTGHNDRTNFIRNGNFSLWQRGTILNSLISGINYGPDRWACVNANNGSIQRVFVSGSIWFAFIASNPQSSFQFRHSFGAIEGAKFAGQRCTFQAKILLIGNMSFPITPQLWIETFDVADNSTPSTRRITQNLQPVLMEDIVGITQLAYTFDAPQDFERGGHIFISLGDALNGSARAAQIAECDLRLDPFENIGINNNPVEPEFYSDDVELIDGLPYYRRWINNGTADAQQPWMAVAGVTATTYHYIPIYPPMRAAPTLKISAPAILRYTTGVSSTFISTAVIGNPLTGPDTAVITVGWPASVGLSQGMTCGIQMLPGGWIEASAEF